jgi:hypothetical protein
LQQVQPIFSKTIDRLNQGTVELTVRIPQKFRNKRHTDRGFVQPWSARCTTDNFVVIDLKDEKNRADERYPDVVLQ